MSNEKVETGEAPLGTRVIVSAVGKTQETTKHMFIQSHPLSVFYVSCPYLAGASITEKVTPDPKNNVGTKPCLLAYPHLS